MNDKVFKLKTELNNLNQYYESNIGDIFIHNLKDYLLMLSYSDKRLKKQEKTFIKLYLDTDIDSDKIKPTSDVPEIFNVLGELRQSIKSERQTIDYLMLTIQDLYKNIGMDFLACDEKVSSVETSFYTKLMNSIRIYIDVFLYDDEDDDFIEDEEPQEINTLDDYINMLNDLTGLESVKQEIQSLVNLVKIRNLRSERGFNNIPMSFHMIFSGNPGTGKTTVARLLAKIYKELGILSSGHLIEVDRSGLVAGYIGQTAIKTSEVIESAIGGILFIDEAYSLVSNTSMGDYGMEAIDTLVKGMEDHRDDLIVIVAGYPDLMKDFVEANPGLKSRFNREFMFNDYNENELYEIFNSFIEKNNYVLTEDAINQIKLFFNKLTNYDIKQLGNARGVRNIFENIVINQASRVVLINNITNEQLITIEKEDILKSII